MEPFIYIVKGNLDIGRPSMGAMMGIVAPIQIFDKFLQSGLIPNGVTGTDALVTTHILQTF